MVQFLNGTVMITISEMEWDLKTKIPLPISYIDEIHKAVNEKDNNIKLQKLNDVFMNVIPTFISELTFEEIMTIFMWEYASPNVEVFEFEV